MNMKLKKTINTIIPSKKINYFTFFVVTLGLISGAIFLVLISQNDKTSVINQITNFMNNINNNNIDSVQALKNSVFTNFTYVLLIWILGMSIIGILFNIFFIYIKGFVLGFSISSLIYVYGVKGILASFIYTFPHQLLNIFVVVILGIYSIMFTNNLYKQIIGNKTGGFKYFIKKYTYILLIAVVITIISTLLETFFTPALFKLFIKLFV